MKTATVRSVIGARSASGILMATIVGLLGLSALVARAERYVVEPGTIAEGGGGIYTNWSIAATQIQWAVDAASAATSHD